MPSFLIALFLGFLPVESSNAADPRFEDHPVETTLETCAPLDFMSTSLARNHQERILSSKPDVKKPNFGGKYLLLNLSLMMEDLWLIADCSTGKFLKPNLDGKARFRPDSLLLELKTKEGVEWQVWKNSVWSRMEVTPVLPPTRVVPSPGPSTGSGIPGMPCPMPDYRSYFKADAVQDNLRKLNPDSDRSNYAGTYRILKNELLFETRWFLMDCRTGKFEKEVLSASRADFTVASELLVLRDDGKFPRHLKWTRGQWVETPDPGRPDHSVRNVLEGPDARKLFAMLPNPTHHDRLEFEDLICEKGPAAPALVCRVRLVSTGSSPGTHVFKIEENTWITKLVGDFGTAAMSPRSEVQSLGIQSGFCLKEKSRCEFEARAVKLKP
jgi:hypothetical protein